MFGIGVPEMILILAIALIVIGPKKLPDLAKSMGRSIREFKKATTEFKESVGVDNELKDVKNTLDDMNKDIRNTVNMEFNEHKNKVQNVSAIPDNVLLDNKEGKKELKKKVPKGSEGSLKDD